MKSLQTRSGAAAAIVSFMLAAVLGGLPSVAEAQSVSGNRARASVGSHLAEARRLVQAKNFRGAEERYRAALQQAPQSRDARLGLARTLLWQLRYREAIAEFDVLLQRNRNDHEARSDRADALYWSGDYRTAAREYESIIAAGRGNEAIRESLAGIRAVAAPGYELQSRATVDDQPYRLFRNEATGTFFVDPLTRIDASVGGYLYDDPRSSNSGTIPFAQLSAETVLPRSRLTLSGSVRAIRFADDQVKLLPAAAASWRIGQTQRLQIGIAQHELLATASSVATHPYVTDAGLSWTLEQERRSAAASARLLRYFDQNSGVGADAYFLQRIFAGDAVSFSVGASVAFRDTEETRFKLREAFGRSTGGGQFRYAYDGIFDPYYTPQAQLEARLIGAVLWSIAKGTLNLHADGGVGRERAVSFGPESGVSPVPSLAEETFDRSYAPWRFAATYRRAASRSFDWTLRYEHNSGSYYEADEFQASLVGRF